MKTVLKIAFSAMLALPLFAGERGAGITLGIITEEGDFTKRIQTSRSTPRIKLNPVSLKDVSYKDGTAQLTISGRVDDEYEGIIATPSLKEVRLYNFGRLCGTLPLKEVVDRPTELAPYARHFTFSGTVPFDAYMDPTDDCFFLQLVTPVNEMGSQGRVEFELVSKKIADAPVFRKKWIIKFKNRCSEDNVDDVELTVPACSPGGLSKKILLKETGNYTQMFKSDQGHVLKIEYSNPDGKDRDLVLAYIEEGFEDEFCGYFYRDFYETEIGSNEYKATTPGFLQLAAELEYILEVPQGKTFETAESIKIQIPKELTGGSLTPVVLERNKARDTEGIFFNGKGYDQFLRFEFRGRKSVNHIDGEIYSGEIAASGIFEKVSDTPLRYRHVRSYSGKGAQYEVTSIKANSVEAVDRLWCPFLFIVRAPAGTDEQWINTEYKWQHYRRKMIMVKRENVPGKENLKTADFVPCMPDGKPFVMVAPPDIAFSVGGGDPSLFCERVYFKEVEVPGHGDEKIKIPLRVVVSEAVLVPHPKGTIRVLVEFDQIWRCKLLDAIENYEEHDLEPRVNFSADWDAVKGVSFEFELPLVKNQAPADGFGGFNPKNVK